jgi:uncharacterized membrane protein
MNKKAFFGLLLSVCLLSYCLVGLISTLISTHSGSILGGWWIDFSIPLYCILCVLV